MPGGGDEATAPSAVARRGPAASRFGDAASIVHSAAVTGPAAASPDFDQGGATDSIGVDRQPLDQGGRRLVG